LGLALYIKEKNMSVNDSINAATAAKDIDDSKEQPIWLLKAAKAPKLGKHTEGQISYQIVADEARLELSVKIVANDGGGYYSKELVPFQKIEACLCKQPEGEPFPSKMLQSAYTGRSSNNAGFLAAILRAEGLLALAPETEGRHIIAGDWDKWQSTVLAEPGTLIESAPAPAEREADAMKDTGSVTGKAADGTRRKKS
jgi:hypothetical protein